MRYDCRRIGDGRQAVLRETKRAVTPFGGLVVLVELLRKMGVLEAVRQRLAFEYRSNNASRPEHVLLAFWLAVAAGARRFSHLQMLRADRALQSLCGVRSFPTDDTVRNFFHRFTHAQVNTFFPALWRWFFAQLPERTCILDLDSTVLQRFGHQEGATRGYNPTRRQGSMHHPLVAFVSEPVLVLHAWLRAGNTPDSRGVVEFLGEALHNAPAHCSIGAVRADSGFFDQKLLEFLEEKTLPYVIVAKRQGTLQRHLHALTQWLPCGNKTAVSEFTLQLPFWTKPRRFIVVRFKLPDPDYQRLLDVPGYDFRVFVTNRSEPAEWLWHHYDQRAAIEPRFSEIKEDLGARGFCLQKFFPTEAAFLSVLFVFNLLSVLQTHCPKNTDVQRRPSSLRHSLFVCGAIAGRTGHKLVLFMSSAWGGLSARKPILDHIFDSFTPTSPKFDSNTAAAPP